MLGSQGLEVSSAEAAELLRALCDLQLRGFAHFYLGQLRVSVRLRPAKPGDRRLHEFELLWEQLIKEKAHFQQTKSRFERSVHASVARERQEIDTIREELRNKASDLHHLKSRLQAVLREDRLCPLPVASVQDCEHTLQELRTQAGTVRALSANFAAAQVELDYAEDLLVRVRNGEDEGAFRSQVEVLKAALVQAKAQRVVTDTERLAQSIGCSLRVLQTNRTFTKSKANVLRKVLERVSPCGSSLSRSPDLSFEGRKPAGLSQGPVTDRSTEEKHTTDLGDKLDRFRCLEEALNQERGKLKGEAHEVAVWKAALEGREEAVALRETALAVLEDRLRASLSQVLGRAEAREFLRLKAAELVQLRRLVETERTELAGRQEAFQAKEVVFVEQKRALDRKMRRVASDQAQIYQQSEKIRTACKELEDFLNKI